MPVYTDVRPAGYNYGEQFVAVPEMIPELIVPDLTNCNLKPYVSYRTPTITEEPFSAKDLFDVFYKPKIESDHREGKLMESGEPVQPSSEESMSPDEARLQARKSGSDIFNEREKKYWEFLDTKLT